LNEFLLFGKAKVAVSVIKNVPHFFFLALVTAVICFRSVESIVILCKKSQPGEENTYKLLVNEDLKFFSKHDINYTFDLVNKKPESEEEIIKKKSLIKRLFENLIYKWDDYFRYA
jgi:hypothetical protein